MPRPSKANLAPLNVVPLNSKLAGNDDASTSGCDFEKVDSIVSDPSPATTTRKRAVWESAPATKSDSPTPGTGYDFKKPQNATSAVLGVKSVTKEQPVSLMSQSTADTMSESAFCSTKTSREADKTKTEQPQRRKSQEQSIEPNGINVSLTGGAEKTLQTKIYDNVMQASNQLNFPAGSTLGSFDSITVDPNLQRIARQLGKAGPVACKDVLHFLQESGLQLDDPRIKTLAALCQGWEQLTEDRASELMKNNLFKKAFQQKLAVKNFPEFTETFKDIFQKVGKNLGGHVATYIPQLANQNPNYWAAAVCSVDGQRFGTGDVDVPFCVQSTSKPITYCAALEIGGETRVHQHVGREPSGRNFNDRCLMTRPGQPSIPHNPYINAGAIMTASLCGMEMNEWDRFKYMMSIWQKLSGGTKPSFQNDTFMGERATASRNFCLAYMMEEERAFPQGTDLKKTLEAYFTWCSIEITSKSMAMLAATLANGGICPTTSERIFSHQTVTNCLSLMMSCGMYDYSGRFAFEIGFPAKSGVSGVLCVVIPGVCGIATFSPRLDSLGNSVRGIDFCTRLSQTFPYHVFSQRRTADDYVKKKNEKGNSSRFASNSSVDDSLQDVPITAESGDAASLWWSAARGDLQRIRQLVVRGMDINIIDYDKRSALHLAASEGHENMVKLLVALEADINAKDHHGNTPMADAIREHRNSAKRTLQLAQRKDRPPSSEPTTGKRGRERRMSITTEVTKRWKKSNYFKYFKENSVVLDGVESVPQDVLVSALDSYGISTDADPRFAILDSMPDPFTEADLEHVAKIEPVIAKALSGRLVVPNFAHLCEKFESLFCETQEISAESQNNRNTNAPTEALNVMTIDGQRLHLGPTDQYVCAGDLISVAVFAVSLEHLGLDVVMDYVGTEPSGVKSDTSLLNSEKLPYNPFMWNGVLALCSLLEEKTGDATTIIADYWAKLCGTSSSDCPMQHDEVFEEEDKQQHGYRVNVLVYTSLDLEKFPARTPPNIVMSTFFRLRAIKTSTTELGSIAAVLANGGIHPTTNVPVFHPDTVRQTLSMMYSAGCEAQSGELSFKVGVPAKSSSEGAILIVLPNIMGLCVVSPTVQDNGVALGCWKFCEDFGSEFNCHVLAGSSTSSAKQDPSLYHFHTEMELGQQLLVAAETGDINTLIQLHQLGFSFDYTDYDYRSPAHVAAANGHVKVLKYLFKKGADVQVKDRWGVIPQEDATLKGHHKAAAALQDMVRDDDGGCGGISDCGSQMSSVSSARGHRSGHSKIERAAAPCAAKMGASGVGSWDCIDEGEDEGMDEEQEGAPSQDDRNSTYTDE